MTAPDAALNEVHKLGCELSESFRKYLGTNLKPKNFWRACNLGSDWLDRNSEGVFKKLQYDVSGVAQFLSFAGPKARSCFHQESFVP